MTNGTKKLRVGVLIDSFESNAWTETMLQRIQQSGDAEIVLVITNETPPKAADFKSRLQAEWNCLLYRLYARVEKSLARPAPNAFQPTTLSLLQDIPRLAVMPTRDETSARLEPEDLEKIRSHELDVIIQLGFTIFLRGEILNCAKAGVWFLRHCDNYVVRGNPSGFWEVFLGLPVTGSLLEMRTEDPYAGYALARSWSSTNQLSATNSRNKYFWKTAAFIPRQLKLLRVQGRENVLRQAERLNPVVDAYAGPWFHTPTNGQFLRHLPAFLIRSCRRIFHQVLFKEHWELMVRAGDGPSTSFRDFKKVSPPRGRFWADPFVVEENNQTYVFFEECIHGNPKAHISVMVMDENGEFSSPEKVLERDHHIAYPMLLKHENTWYMIPDASANGTIDVYRCDAFPNKWSHHACLMKDLHAADPTLFEWAGKWWLMATVKEHPATSYWDELFLFSADEPFGNNWTPHPLNPIVSDVRKARPGGPVFQKDGQLIRISQNCSRGYGYGINFHEIVTLTESDYVEQDLQTIEPNWSPAVKGLHTWSNAGDVTFIDAKSYRCKWF